MAYCSKEDRVELTTAEPRQSQPLIRQFADGYEIDGARFSALEEFYAEFSRVVIPGCDPQLTNLDAFDDILSGGYGKSDDGFTLRWSFLSTRDWREYKLPTS
jgi:hypothetical protein